MLSVVFQFWFIQLIFQLPTLYRITITVQGMWCYVVWLSNHNTLYLLGWIWWFNQNSSHNRYRTHISLFYSISQQHHSPPPSSISVRYRSFRFDVFKTNWCVAYGTCILYCVTKYKSRGGPSQYNEIDRIFINI